MSEYPFYDGNLNEKLFRVMFEVAGDAVLLLKGEHYIECNSKAQRILGVEREYLIGKTPWDISPEKQLNGRESKICAREKIGDVLSGKEQFFEWQHLSSKGQILDMEISLTLVDREEELFIAIWRNIASRKIAEKALHESEYKLRSIFENSPIAIFQMNPEGVPVSFNTACEQLTGYSGRELFSVRFESIIYPEDFELARKGFTDLVSGSVGSLHLELRLVRKDGEIRWGNLHAGFLKEDSGQVKYVIALVEDITEKKKNSLELIQAQKLKSLGELAAAMAHEINQPLSGILMASENALMRLEENPGNIDYFRKKMTDIGQYIERIKNIIDHVRTFSREQKLAVSGPVNINDSIRNAVSLVKTQYMNHNVTIQLDLDDHIPLVNGNLFTFEQVVLNLVGNSYNALTRKEGSADRIIRLKTGSANNRVTLEVYDNGTGMKEELLSRIFEPFFTTKEADEGTGLGLSVSYGIIRGMEGSISVRSQEGQYTEFLIELPALNTGVTE